MMKVCYSELDGPEGLSCRLEAAGHAGFAPAGQDIVCAGASTLMQALVYLLAGEENAHADAWEKPDGPVQTLSTGTTTALDFRIAALPRTAPVEKSWFSQVSFVGDSLTQGMQMYDTGLPGAMFCAYRGVGPNAIVNGTSCKRADGAAEVPLDALTAQQPKAVYLLLGTNVLGTDSDYTSFLTYYRLMLDMITQALPGTPVYVQSITPVRPEVAAKKGHEGLNRDRLCRINDELAAVALEKNCSFLNLWEVLADENGDLKAEYAQPDGYHLKPEGYTAWVDYLCSHTAG